MLLVSNNAKLSALNGLFRFLGWEECRVKFLRVQRRVFRVCCWFLNIEYAAALLSPPRKLRTAQTEGILVAIPRRSRYTVE